jgi:hypothetical protein
MIYDALNVIMQRRRNLKLIIFMLLLSLHETVVDGGSKKGEGCFRREYTL